MGPEGEDASLHVSRQYGTRDGTTRTNRAAHPRAKRGVGFVFDERGGRIQNTFDAHRLLHWAGQEGATGSSASSMHCSRPTTRRGEIAGDHELLLNARGRGRSVGARAHEVLASAVTPPRSARPNDSAGAGIRWVPAVVIVERHLISGGQPPEVFEQALRRIARRTAEPRSERGPERQQDPSRFSARPAGGAAIKFERL